MFSSFFATLLTRKFLYVVHPSFVLHSWLLGILGICPVMMSGCLFLLLFLCSLSFLPPFISFSCFHTDSDHLFKVAVLVLCFFYLTNELPPFLLFFVHPFIHSITQSCVWSSWIPRLKRLEKKPEGKEYSSRWHEFLQSFYPPFILTVTSFFLFF